MTVDDGHIYRYHLPFRQLLRMPGQTLTHREGFLLNLQSGDKNGWGEIAPFPGLSYETLADVLIYLSKNRQMLQGRIFHADDWRSLLKEAEALNIPYPSAQFGVESALLNLYAEQRGMTLTDLLGCGGRQYVLSNGLVTSATLENLLENAQQLLNEGFCTLKIKVGRFAIDQEIEFIRAIRQAAGDAALLRLDANRVWPLEEALRFAKGIGLEQIEYIEEPVKSAQDMEKFCRHTHLPVALDESLIEATPLPPRLKIAACILKPGILGGFAGIFHWINVAKRHGALPVISSPFLSAVGLRMAVHLAAAFTPADAVAGLDASSALAVDFLRAPLTFKNGRLNIADLDHQLYIDPSLMQKVI